MAQKSNLLDRAIEAVSPGWAVKRLHARTTLALAGGYTGGKRNRPALANFNPGVGDADSDTVYDLETLRARSRDLARNAPIAAGAINTVVTNVIGTGLTMKSSIDYDYLGLTEEQASNWQSHAEREYLTWAESTDCDITRTQNFYGLQDLALRSMLESGDVVALTPTLKRSLPYELTIQLIEADRLCNKNWVQDTQNLVQGVVLDDHGGPAKYQICKQHPGAIRRSGLQWVEIDAFSSTGRRNVLHLFERKRPGQHRGVPYLAGIIEPLKQLDRYTEAELSAAVISAVHAMFVKMDPNAFDDLFSDDKNRKAYIGAAMSWDGGIPQADIGEAGKVINLLPGEDIVSPNLGRPNDKFDPFVLAILRQMGVALELPFEVLIKHYTASYSAARAALLDAWRVFRKRRDWMATYLCQPIYELWLAEAVALGRIAAPGFFNDPVRRRAWSHALWIGDGPGAIDPYKEAQAADRRVETGISTLDNESVMYDGIPWEIKHRQRAKEQRMRREDGLLTETTASPAVTVQTNEEPS